MSTEKPTAEEIQEAAKAVNLLYTSDIVFAGKLVEFAINHALSEATGATPDTAGSLLFKFASLYEKEAEALKEKEAEQLV